MYVITGATSRTGSVVANYLLERGQSVRGMEGMQNGWLHLPKKVLISLSLNLQTRWR